jgi:hypothetical protein
MIVLSDPAKQVFEVANILRPDTIYRGSRQKTIEVAK